MCRASSSICAAMCSFSSSLAPIMNTGSSISTCRSPWWKPDATAMNDCRSSSVIFSSQSILSWLKSRS